MSTLLYGMNPGTPPGDEAAVRSTVTVVAPDAPSSMQEHAPDFNELATDGPTEGGLTAHQLGSHVVASIRGLPVIGNANDDPNSIINRQVSTSGTAAAREAAGIQGHGTLMVTEGIEPAIRDGQAFTEDYFAAGERTAQQDVANYMTPSQAADPATSAAAQAAGEAASRAAVQSSQYSAFLHAQTGL